MITLGVKFYLIYSFSCLVFTIGISTTGALHWHGGGFLSPWKYTCLCQHSIDGGGVFLAGQSPLNGQSCVDGKLKQLILRLFHTKLTTNPFDTVPRRVTKASDVHCTVRSFWPTANGQWIP